MLIDDGRFMAVVRGEGLPNEWNRVLVLASARLRKFGLWPEPGAGGDSLS
jgi:hypothetical protein